MYLQLGRLFEIGSKCNMDDVTDTHTHTHTHTHMHMHTQWEDQHNDTSCEEFAQWKKDNDPEAQQQGLAAHLTANGIGKSCMHLATIGCMHTPQWHILTPHC